MMFLLLYKITNYKKKVDRSDFNLKETSMASLVVYCCLKKCFKI